MGPRRGYSSVATAPGRLQPSRGPVLGMVRDGSVVDRPFLVPQCLGMVGGRMTFWREFWRIFAWMAGIVAVLLLLGLLVQLVQLT
jgi:hypothetical protein